MSYPSSRIRISKKGVMNIPPNLLNTAGLNSSSHVWIISDGNILIIKNLFIKKQSSTQPIIRHIRGVFKRLLSR